MGTGLWESPLETGLFGSTTLPSTLWGFAFMAVFTSSTRHVWQTQSLWTAWCLDPSLPRSLWVFSIAQNGSVVSKLNPPMKSFHSCSGSLGNSDLDMTAVDRGKDFNNAFPATSMSRRAPSNNFYVCMYMVEIKLYLKFFILLFNLSTFYNNHFSILFKNCMC